MGTSTPVTASAPATSPRPPTILLLTHSRTASHVLERMLSNQPNVLYGSHFYGEGRVQRRELLTAGPLHTTDPTLQAKLLQTLNEGHKRFEEFLANAKRQGETAFVHTQPHSMISPQQASNYIWGPPPTNISPQATDSDWLVGSLDQRHTNPTVLPDSAFLHPDTIAILNFRHPLLLVDGIYRGLHDLPAFRQQEGSRTLLTNGANLHWPRVMYNWFLSQDKEPIVLDADDYLGPEKYSLMRNLCQRTPGFDSASVIYTWPKATADEMAAMPEALRQSQQTISASEGVMEGYDSRGRSLDTEMIQWTAKYGEEEADFLKGLVEGAMEDYEFLRERKLRPDGTTRSRSLSEKDHSVGHIAP